MKQRIPKLRICLGTMGAVDQGKTTLTTAIGQAMAKHSTQEKLRVYEAIVSRDPTGPGHHASVVAENLLQAQDLLEKEHGKGSVFSLWNEEDQFKPRR